MAGLGSMAKKYIDNSFWDIFSNLIIHSLAITTVCWATLDRLIESGI